MTQATIPGMPDVRAPAGVHSPFMERDMLDSFAQESREDFPVDAQGVALYPHLALSGGGANGAFGAGFLNGWSATGQRPVFKVVTGVSTGALMAPFAFLGQPGDHALYQFYTTTGSRDIFALGEIVSIARRLLYGEAIADASPLLTLIEQYVDDALLREIALAHARGRRLYIGTVDLDSQRFIVWNMGLIASSGHADAPQLFRKVMLASASIPVAFSPVLFDVEAGGQRYDEMHVDGGVFANVFYSGGLFSARDVRQQVGRDTAREDIYVIHNGQLSSHGATTRRSVADIARRSFQAAGTSAVIGDLFRIYTLALREGSDFHWITIDENLLLTRNEVFDPLVMRQLYDTGYAAAQADRVWSTVPPGLSQPSYTASQASALAPRKAGLR